ncbi:Alpha/Beta hydrolase protein [Globomyces pollinis-pini]|nr:Alpha/Beta hydrolase protein [Globomyces pollinis-pini]
MDTRTSQVQLPDGTEIEFEQVNAGLSVPIVLVLGLLQDTSDYLTLLKTINRHFIIIHPRGQGKSQRVSASDFTLLQLATDIFDVILHLNLVEFYLMGSDLGGTACLQLAFLLKGRDDMNCRGLILVSSFPTPISRGLLKHTIYNFTPELWVRRCMGDKWCDIEKDQFKVLSKRVGTFNIDVLKEQMYCIDGCNITDQLSLLDVRTLLIHGRDDVLVNSNYSSMIADGLKDSEIHILPDTGHWPQIDSSETIGSIVNLFLNE